MKERLVVIGNGMAGARLVEDLLARGGGRRFDVAMFGDEPYGNYNRILLSSVLARSHDPKDIFINPLAWYQESGVTLHAGARVTRIDREARMVYAGGDIAAPYDHLVIATGSKAFIPPIAGMHDERGDVAVVDAHRAHRPALGLRCLIGDRQAHVLRVGLREDLDFGERPRNAGADRLQVGLLAGPQPEERTRRGIAVELAERRLLPMREIAGREVARRHLA